MNDAASIPDTVRFAACHSVVVTPDPPPGSAATVERRPSWALLMTAMPTVNLVDPFDVEVGSLTDTVTEVRETLRRHGRHQAAWRVPAGSRLHEGLLGLGMTPYREPPLDEVEYCMAIVTAPEVDPVPGVTVTLARTPEDYAAGADLAGEVFGMADADRAGLREAWQLRRRLAEQGVPTGSSFLAHLDGRLVGYANAQRFDHGVFLFGSGVLPSARGRGVYAALVAARWEHAVELGRPALTVGAGPMSHPRLRRLGFQVVAELAVLKDDTVG